jgi:hypothetical protein
MPGCFMRTCLDRFRCYTHVCVLAMASPLLGLRWCKLQYVTYYHPERPDLALLFDAAKEGISRDPSLCRV